MIPKQCTEHSRCIPGPEWHATRSDAADSSRGRVWTRRRGQGREVLSWTEPDAPSDAVVVKVPLHVFRRPTGHALAVGVVARRPCRVDVARQHGPY